MAESTSVTDIIVWTSPVVGAFALYLAHDAYTSIKEDIKEVVERQIKTREDLFGFKTDIKAISRKIDTTNENLDSNTDSVRRIDLKITDAHENMSSIGQRLSTNEENYGKIIIVLKKVISILKPNSHQDPK